MNKKMILIGLISLVALISISSISASDSTYNNNHCYACNYSDCQCSNSCLCKDPNYKIITENETKIRNNNNCYYCNETCNCPNDCSCKQVDKAEDSIYSSKNPVINIWNYFINSIINIIKPDSNPNNTQNTTPNNTTNTTSQNTSINNTTTDNSSDVGGADNSQSTTSNVETPEQNPTEVSTRGVNSQSQEVSQEQVEY